MGPPFPVRVTLEIICNYMFLLEIAPVLAAESGQQAPPWWPVPVANMHLEQREIGRRIIGHDQDVDKKDLSTMDAGETILDIARSISFGFPATIPNSEM